MTWQPPSVKAAAKLPTIEIEGVNRVQHYLDWLDAHTEIPRAVPPLYREFRILFRRSYYAPGKDARERVYEYAEIVHYDDDLAGFAAAHVIDGKKVCLVTTRYVDYNGVNVKAAVTAPPSTPYQLDWIRREGVAVVYTVLSVQAYLLYHRPEIVPVFLTDPPKPRAQRAAPRKAEPKPRAVRDTVKRYIRLSETDAEPTARQYRAIQWTVRGHYRRLTDKQGAERLVYIKPHTAKRGEKRLKTSGLILKAGKED